MLWIFTIREYEEGEGKERGAGGGQKGGKERGGHSCSYTLLPGLALSQNFLVEPG